MGPAVEVLEGLGQQPGIGEARHRHPLAPKGLQAVLGLGKPSSEKGETRDYPRYPGTRSEDVSSQSTLGSAESSRRIAQARDRDIAGNGLQVYAPP